MGVGNLTRLKLAKCALILEYLKDGKTSSVTIAHKLITDKVRPSLVMTPKQITIMVRSYLMGYVELEKKDGRTYMSLKREVAQEA